MYHNARKMCDIDYADRICPNFIEVKRTTMRAERQFYSNKTLVFPNFRKSSFQPAENSVRRPHGRSWGNLNSIFGLAWHVIIGFSEN